VLCEQFGVCRSSYKYWRSRRRIIDSDKVKLRALVSEKHELSIARLGISQFWVKGLVGCMVDIGIR
jgi:hypothetical protein